MILIFGRREEFDGNTEKTRHRANLLGIQSEELVSFDRLKPDSDGWNLFTVRAQAPGRFQAIAVPATFQLGPALATELSGIEGLDEAISRNDLISPKRKQFLTERLAYWRDWAANENNGVSKGGWE